MASVSGDIWHDNPFPLIPVVRLGPSADLGAAPVEAADSGNATVGTPTLEELSQLVDDYLTERPVGGRRGRTIALVGDFGLGKSHALREVYAALGARPDGPAMWIVDEPAQDMGRMYRDRLRGPGDTSRGRRAFEELVRDYYAYVTANRVGEQGSDPRLGTLDEIAAGLRDRSLDPDKVVSALRYDPEVIHADLRGTLGEVTEHRRFATALALLQEPPFTRMVWKWLNGEEPAEPLRERGITEAIGPSGGAGGQQYAAAGIDRVFDALAVQGFLHGRVGSPYVLLMDSLEKVLDWPEENRRTFVDAFERLVNIYASRGGLLVFCVSPDGLQALRASVHERVVQLWPTGFSERLTGELVAAYVGAGPDRSVPRPRRSSGPFGPDALRLLYELTEGVPREVLRTCRQAWQLSEDRDGAVREVTAAAVLEAVSFLHEKVSKREVTADVHKALDLGQWRIASSDPVPARVSSPPDTDEEVLYWLAPAPNTYLAVILTRSVLLAGDAERIAAHVHGLRNAVHPARFEALLVVNGHVSQPMQDRLARSIGSRPLVYRQGPFAQSVDEALRQLGRRLEEVRREEDLVQLGERMRRDLERQTAQLTELRQAMDTLTLEARPGAVPRRTEPSTPQLTGPVPESPSEPEQAAADLPGPVRRRFREALAVLDTVTRRVAGRTMTRRSAATPAELGALGCATLVRALTEDFRGSVAAWHRTALRGVPTDDQLSELRRICREYETAVEVLPVHLLGSAGQAHPLTAARTVEVLAEEVWGTLSAATVP
ncbi:MULTISPECIES: hypothetical protein [unclassified Streptomyces]|uniref:hypothetical protein n=1 Tax=unclassified Streptomyces TaxID=2593676 RepID=UPI002E805D73|nr:hypothetical protein [Streptomyces sp. NBC_00589]WTI40451.1 hypothetical protein OIC96_38385 [Streptomyces sp. NBC_00775]WUB25865.1 hypothetical protein OHA51_11345 [Streptomyces sp. NBC_00589]